MGSAPEEAFPNDVCCFSHSLQADAGMLPQIRPRPIPVTTFPIHYSRNIIRFVEHHTIRRYTNWVTGRVVKSAVKSKVFPVQAMKTYVGPRGIPPLILNLGTSIPRRFPSFLIPREEPCYLSDMRLDGTPLSRYGLLVKKLVAPAGNQSPDRHVQECKNVCCTILYRLQEYTASHPRRKYLDVSVCFVCSKPNTREAAQFHNTE